MSQLKKLRKTPGNDAWEELMLAGMAGIDAIHSMRRENYLSALSGAFAAMEHIAEAQALAPDFPDLKLADGMYHYWRTVITMSSKKLPDYGDSRAQGIEEMLYARDNGVFLAVPASLALTYTWLEERKFKLALAEGERSQESYPDNVINNLVVGRTYIARRKYKAALEEFDHVMAISPENTRVHYYRAIALYRTKDLEASEAALKTYLASEYLEESHEAAAYFRLGKIYFVQNKLDEAEVEYKKAVKLTGHGGAKAGLSYIKKRRAAAKG